MADGPPPLRAHLTELAGRLARLIGSGRSTEGVVAACVRMLESSVSKYELPQVCLPSELLPFPAFPFRRNAAHRRPLASIAAYVMTAKPLPPPPRGPSPLLPPPLAALLAGLGPADAARAAGDGPRPGRLCRQIRGAQDARVRALATTPLSLDAPLQL